MQDELVSVVIPNWNGRELLARCLPAVLSQTYTPIEVIVIDNGSRDGSADWVARNFPKIKLLRNTINIGFAAGCNLGIRESRGTFVATLNNDAYASPDWLTALVREMKKDAQIGMCASLMVLYSDPGRIDSAGIAIDRAGIAWNRLGGQPVSSSESEPVEIFGPCAGAALYRRKMLEEIGLFDERFFAYLEDVDLAWRAQIAGWRCQYVPQAVVRHLTSASFGKDSPLKKQLKARNKVWMVVKNAPASDFPLIFFYDWAAVLYALIKNRDINPLKGRLQGLKRVHLFLKDRKPGRPRVLEPLVPPWQVPKRWGG
jgi:GT2 family glycosyltransferase